MKTTIEKYVEKRNVMPLLCWDIFTQYALTKNSDTTKQHQDLAQLLYFASKYKWQSDIKNIITTNEYEALVLTNLSKEILWVNEGFTTMTGYSREFAKHKRPDFLQGESTSIKQRLTIRKKLQKDLPFKEVIINHKKDGTPYKCEIFVIPLKNYETTHYLALERAV